MNTFQKEVPAAPEAVAAPEMPSALFIGALTVGGGGSWAGTAACCG